VAQWNENATLEALLPSELSDVIDAAQTVVGTSSDILGTISTGLGVASAFLTGLPALDWVAALQSLLDQLKNNYLGAGFYYLPLWNYGIDLQYQLSVYGAKLGISEIRTSEGLNDFINLINTSYDDTADEERPTFVPGGVTAGLCLAVGAPSFEELIQVFNAFRTFWSSNISLDALWRAMMNMADPDAVIEPDVPIEPNWETLNLKTLLPSFVNLIEEGLDAIISALQTGLNSADALALLIDVIKSKVDRLNTLLQRINNYLSDFESVLGAAGIWSAYIETSDGIEGLKTELLTATNRPDWGAHPYVAGAMFVAGGPDVEPFRNMFGVLA
jgi:hypothetical protein